MRFEHPHLLWLLLVLPPVLLAFFWWSWRKKQKLLVQFIETRLLSALTVGISPARQKLRFAFFILAVAFLIVALARPQHGFDLEEVQQNGLDIVVAIDTSKSMLAEDIAPNRLARAKLAALELMQDAKADRLGLVAFAGDAFLECPLTIDNTAFEQSVQALDVNTIPQGGTALAAAINTALTAFKEKDHYKALVLLTDGEDNVNEADVLADTQSAAKQGLRIFTVGIGTPAGDLLRVTDANGNGDYIRDANGDVVKSHLNEELLQQIARATEGGFYLPLRANTIDALYETGLAPLPKTEAKEKLVRRYHEQFQWPLAAAILLLLVEMLLPERKRAAKSAGMVLKTGAVRAAAVVIALCVLPGVTFGSTSSALREFNAGQYDKALDDYQKLLQKKTGDPRLDFDAGAAAYRDQKFDEAMTNFSATISAPDLKLQESSYYNLGNTLYRLGERNSDLDKKKESWESALKNYDSSLKLNSQDADAKFNYDLVKKKLEELKKQQQQNQQRQQQQAQNTQSQQKQQSQNSGSQQNQSQRQTQQNSQQNQSQQNSQEQQNQQAQNQSDQQKQEQQQAQQKSGEQNDQESGAKPAQAMTPQEAKQLLDAQKGDEQFLSLKPKEKPENQNQPVKDW
jgi:Ca-activated chloride channel family protein